MRGNGQSLLSKHNLLLCIVSCVIISLNIVHVLADGGTICYEDPTCNEDNPNSVWQHGMCHDGKMQSPINIRLNIVKPAEGSPIQWTKLDYDITSFTLVNSGATLKMTELKSKTGKQPLFNWAERNNSVYTLDHIHFHWGQNDRIGSEHTIDNHTYSEEMHFVHYRSGGDKGGFKGVAEAVASGQEDALSVIAILFQGQPDHDEECSSILDPVTNNLDKTPKTGDKVEIKEEVLLNELLHMQHKAVTYMGSLTTPDCNEVVAWLVTLEPIKVKSKELDKMRHIAHEHKGDTETLTHNFRHVRQDDRPLRYVEFQDN